MHRIGEIFDGRYQLSRPLGVRRGAEMWEAEHQVVGRKVTLKIMSPEASSDPMVRRRLVFEARAASEIAHPSVVEVHDVGVTTDGTAYLVSEPLRGEILADVISRHGAMQSADACQVMLQVLAGLEAAHEANILHGDLRSDCVILRRGRDGELIVKLLDFGVETAPLDSLTPPPASSSRSAARTVDPAVDLEAAGALLLEMLSGRSPEHEDVSESNGGRAGGGQPGLVIGVPGQLTRIVEQTLSPSARSVQSAKELASLLAPFAVSDRAPSLAPRNTLMPFLSPEARKSRGMARLERAVLGASARPNLVVIGGSTGVAMENVGRAEGSLRSELRDSLRALNAEDLLEPRIPKAPRAPRHLASHLPRFSRPDVRLEPGPRPVRRSSLPLRKWKAAKPTPEPPAAAPSAPPPMSKTGSVALHLWSAGLLAAAGLGAGLLLARLLHF